MGTSNLGRPSRRRVGRRRVLKLAGAGAGIIPLAAACRRAGSTANQSGAAASQPKYGGSISPRITADITIWNASTERSTDVTKGIRPVYDGLLGYKSSADVAYDRYAVQPRLAEKWEIPDPQTYLFHLRKGVTFQNLPPVNGRGFVSNDVEWSYELLSTTGPFKSPGVTPSIYRYDFLGMDRIDTPDDSAVSVQFQEPFAPFLNYVANERIAIVPHEIWDQDNKLTNLIIGTGPFQLDAAASQKDTRFVWKKNPTYWEKGKPYIDAINWYIISEDATAFAAFETGQIDSMEHNVEAPAMQQVKKSRPDA